MRTTLTLDEDVAGKLQALARRSGRAFKQVVNDVLRRGLATTTARPAPTRFTVQARDLGARRADLSLDNIGDVLERVEGPLHR